MVYQASCHCGAVLLQMQRKPRQLTQCNCSICRRYGALWSYCQRKTIQVRAAKGHIKPYTWKDRRFEFFHCTNCGCVTHYERADRRADGSDMAAVNLRNIDDTSIVASLPIRLIDGDGSWKILATGLQPYLLRSPGRQSGHDGKLTGPLPGSHRGNSSAY